ncbi:hypothetical protein K503DRAFT_768220, partial [Rhizopogon vinicolor AM-OR11-026]
CSTPLSRRWSEPEDQIRVTKDKLNLKKLSPSLRKTNALLANWATNPKRVKRKGLESPYLPEFLESE